MKLTRYYNRPGPDVWPSLCGACGAVCVCTFHPPSSVHSSASECVLCSKCRTKCVTGAHPVMKKSVGVCFTHLGEVCNKIMKVHPDWSIQPCGDCLRDDHQINLKLLYGSIIIIGTAV